MLPTLQFARATLKHWYTWNCSPSYARITSSLARLFVAFAGTKHCCLTAINRDGALCCPDFPRDRGLKLEVFLPLSRDEPAHYILFLCSLRSHCVGFADIVCALRRWCLALQDVMRLGRRAAYGNRTRLLGLGSRCTTDVLMPQSFERAKVQ